MSYTQEILGHYDLYAKYNIDNVEQASIAGLGEAHRNSNCLAWNGRFISENAKKSPVAIFVEGYLSMERVQSSIKRQKELLHISADVPDENILVFGWDIDPEILQKYKEQYDQEIIQFNKNADDLLEKLSLLNKELTTYSNELHKIIPEFDIEQFSEMGLTWLEQIKDPIDYKRFMELVPQCASIYVKKQNVRIELKSLPFPAPPSS